MTTHDELLLREKIAKEVEHFVAGVILSPDPMVNIIAILGVIRRSK